MRARYYSPDMRRFVNADIIHGDISNAVTLNRFAYANGNPVSNIDPFGLRAERLISHAMVRDGGGEKEACLQESQKAETQYRASWKSITGYAGNDIASASGGLYAATAYAGLIDKGFGAEAGVAAATAEGSLCLGNLSLSGETNALHAEASAEFVYEDEFKLGAEAKAAVVTAEADFTIDLWFMEIEIGVEVIWYFPSSSSYSPVSPS